MTQSFSVSTYHDHSEELEELKKLGFATNPMNKVVNSLEEAWEYADSIHKNKDDLSYQIDGAVIKLRNNTLTNILGVVGKTPRGWSAIKFQGEEAVSQVLDIVWQVGRTGKLTPVAELSPVEIAGSVVRRATLHNYKEVVESGILIGDQVVVHKAGDIIPEVKNILVNLRDETIKKPEIPHNCPGCGSVLVFSKTGVDLVCKNESCTAQVVGRLSYFSQRSIANITGLSEKTIEKFVELFGVQDVADLYTLPYHKIFELEGFGQQSVENLKSSIEESKHMSVAKFFAGLGVDGVGQEVAQLILTSIPRLQSSHPQELKAETLL